MKANAADEFRKKLETMTQNELFELALKLMLENRELQCLRDDLEQRVQAERTRRERERLIGVIEGLKFSIRCNGVSGGDNQII